ncbi:MAG: AEC family transporter [Pseudomonadota bacterium]|nr:AEC family transporter [Pseudomonadota bacterium]
MPVFAVILVGYGIARTPKWTPDATRYFNNFVFYVCLPTLLFGKLASGTAFDGVEPFIVVAYFGGGLISMLLMMVFSGLVFKRSGEERALMGMSAGFSNSVLLGLPLIVLTFGDVALGPITTMIAFNTLILLPTTIILLEIAHGRRKQKSITTIVLAPLAAMLRNPILIAIVSGVAWSFTNIEFALPIDRFINLMSGAAGPCALFVLGASLAEYKFAGQPAETASMIIAKLIVHPILVWLLCTKVFALDTLTTNVATMMAAVPVGATVFTLAQQYRVFVGPVTSSILISTAISAVSLAVVIGLLN